MIGRHVFAGGGPHRRCAIGSNLDRHRFVMQITGAARDRIRTHRAQQTVGVEPALVLQAQRGAGQVLRVEPRKSCGDLRAFEQCDIGAFGKLHVAIGAQRRRALRTGQHEIGPVHQADTLGHRFEKCRSEQRHPYVERQ